MKKSILLLVFALTAFCAASCIYDFNPDLKGQDGYLVVEGDILIGDYTNVSVRFSDPLQPDKDRETKSVNVRRVTVEASDGTVYTRSGSWGVDTRNADPKQQYRLVLEIEGRGTYVKKDMTLDISASGEGSRYYRWTAQQTWEYHAPYDASHFYVPVGGILNGEVMLRDTVAMYESGQNYYWCWNSAAVHEMMMASSAGLSENRIVRHPLFSMNCYEQRCMYLYSILICQEGISEEAWRYYQAMERNSTDVGGLFSPEPSEMRGNIYKEDDPSELVLGYVSVSAPRIQRFFISMTSFGRMRRDAYADEPVYVPRNEWRKRWREDWSVYMLHTDEAAGTGRESEADYEFDWLPTYCVDCRRQGGFKTKPDYWPNDHT